MPHRSRLLPEPIPSPIVQERVKQFADHARAQAAT